MIGRVKLPARSAVLGVVGALYIGVVAPAQRSRLNDTGGLWPFVALAVVALIVLAVLPRPWWIARLAVAGATAVVTLATEGKLMSLWAPSSLLLAVWVTADRPPIPLRRRPADGMTVVVMVGSYLAFRAGSRLEAVWQPMAVLAGTSLAVLVSVRRSSRVGSWLVGERHGVARVASSLPAFAVYPVMMLARLLVFALLRPDQPAQAGWQHSSMLAPNPRSAGRRPDRGRRMRVWTKAATAIGIVGLLVWLVVPDGLGRVRTSAALLGVPLPGDPIPAAYRGDSWYPGFKRDLEWVTDERVAWRPMTVQRVLDVRTSTVNVVDRQRTSWTAPACSCKRVTAWMYGGSGAFGLGQRDEHTIASDLARLAAADGMVLDVQNRGIPGEMHWRNSTRFAWDLTVDPKPDVVLFYEGGEEVASELELERRGLGNTLAPFEPFLTNLYDEVAGVPERPPTPPSGIEYLGWPKVDDGERQPGHLATERYERSRSMSEATAAAHQLPVDYFWQPSRFEAAMTATGLSADELTRMRAFQGAAASVPTGVVNLSSSLDDVPGPLFSDDTNHNERAAMAIAKAMWADLRDQVRTLSKGA